MSVVPFHKPGVVRLENGRHYQTVPLRLKKFRADHPDWRVISEIVKVSATRVILKASILDETGRLRATGHAEEFRNASLINQFAAVPNGETSAVGRALFCLGYVPTQEELQPVEIDGNQYQKVAYRILQLREQFPQHALISEILHQDEHLFLIKACVLDDKGSTLSCGHAEEVRSADPQNINSGHLLENAETSAWGRALGFFRFHGDDIATAEELWAARSRQGQQPSTSAPHAHQAAQPQQQPPRPQPPAKQPRTDQAEINKVQGEVMNRLKQSGFSDQTPRERAIYAGQHFPETDFFLRQELMSPDRKVFGKRILAFCQPGSAATPLLQGLGFQQDTASNWWMLDLKFSNFASDYRA
ncbi:hypothetical protein [Geoalkalibacter halelectricus]|uniref:hypothetical protein n=1 Tax=Geoalkalibacter halelectricus TaxID=2847045 RepID=UPI003D21DE34